MTPSSPTVHHIPDTDFAVIIATWEQTTQRVPSGATVLPGGLEAVRYQTPLDLAVSQLLGEGYEKVKQAVFSDDRSTVTIARKSRPSKGRA